MWIAPRVGGGTAGIRAGRSQGPLGLRSVSLCDLVWRATAGRAFAVSGADAPLAHRPSPVNSSEYPPPPPLQGQWGGVRAAAGLRPILSELGCLPVSAMIHVPAAHAVLTPVGECAGEDEARWTAYAARGIAQMEW